MKELKFRAWDKDEKKMHLIDMIYFRGSSDEISKKSGIKGDSRRVGFLTDSGYQVFYNFELMQYTGLFDRNGKEIYEGDIVQNKSLSMKGEIKMGFNDTAIGKHYGWYIHRYMKIGKDKASSWESPYWEIIGNIYENPEDALSLPIFI